MRKLENFSFFRVSRSGNLAGWIRGSFAWVCMRETAVWFRTKPLFNFDSWTPRRIKRLFRGRFVAREVVQWLLLMHIHLQNEHLWNYYYKNDCLCTTLLVSLKIVLKLMLIKLVHRSTKILLFRLLKKYFLFSFAAITCEK